MISKKMARLVFLRFSALWMICMMVISMVGVQPARAALIDAPNPQGTDPIPALLAAINEQNLRNVAADLVAFGPRRADVYTPFIDANCTPAATPFPKTTIEMSSDYVKAAFLAMGYPESAITMEDVPNGSGSWGHNVYVTKIGSAYPNHFIEFGGHLDTQPGTPGGNDNASGSTAVIELARVLKDYPNRYSMRFALWVAEEITVPPPGSYYHVQQALLRGEKFKAGLNIDSTGWTDAPLPDGTPVLMNELWYNDSESLRINNLFDTVRAQYGINIGFRKTPATITSDERAYWFNGQTAVTSVGGWTTYHPNFHGCGDTVANMDFTNILRSTQQNLAVGLILDAEVMPPTVTLALSPNTLPANGTATATATATVRGPDGNPMPSETVVFSTSGDVSLSAVTNLGGGAYQVTVTASNTPGTETITAAVGGSSASALLQESISCPGTCFLDATTAQFQAGNAGSGVFVSEGDDGQMILTPVVASRFDSTVLPAGWSVNQYSLAGTSGTATLSGGSVSLGGVRLLTDATFGPGHSLEYVATFTGDMFQAAGFGANFDNPPWAAFSTANTNNALHAYTSGQLTPIAGNWFGTPHRYRIDWTAEGFIYSIDGVQVASHVAAISVPMKIIFSDYEPSANNLKVDWVQMSPYALTGEFTSRVFDAGVSSSWGSALWSAQTPAGTSLTFSARAGNTPVPDATWSAFMPLTNGASLGAQARYAQYRVALATTDEAVSPVIDMVSLAYTQGSAGAPSKLAFRQQPGGGTTIRPWATQPVVEVQDSDGNTVIGDQATPVTLSIGANPGGATLTCTANPVQALNGVAAFSGCRMNRTGSDYSLIASAPGLESASSASFNLTAVQPASITLALSTAEIFADGASTVTVTVIVKDAGGLGLPGETIALTTSGDVTVGAVTDHGDGTYTATLTASTTAGNETITAAAGALSATAVLAEHIFCPGGCPTDTTVAHFTAGQPDANLYIAEAGDGELILKPTLGTDFSVPVIPAGFQVQPYSGAGVYQIENGRLALNGAILYSVDSLAPGHSVEYEATYVAGNPYQAAGYWLFNTSPWRAFDLGSGGGALQAAASEGGATLVTGNPIGVPHRYRVDWMESGVTYWVDGVQVSTALPTAAGARMNLILADYGANATPASDLKVNWVRMSPYATSGTFLSRVFDAGIPARWTQMAGLGQTPVGTSFVLSYRSGSTPTPDATWTDFTTLAASQNVIDAPGRYFQYRAVLSTTDPHRTPVLEDVSLAFEAVQTNAAPVAAADSYNTTKDLALVIPAPGVLGNDTDADGDTLTAAVGNGPSHGTLALNANGAFTYTPATGYTGLDSFTYTASDGQATSGAATVSIEVKGSVVPPVLPSVFTGQLIYNAPAVPPAGKSIVAYVSGLAAPVAVAAITEQPDGILTYIIDVPGDLPDTPVKEGGVAGDTVTFEIDGRVVAKGVWHSGTRVQIDIHGARLHLQAGWNLISLPLKPAATTPAEVLESAAGQYDLVYAWDAAAQGWLSFAPVPERTNTLTSIDQNTGFWVQVTAPAGADLDVAGQAPSGAAVPVVAGWNLVGYPASAGPIPAGYGLVYSYRPSLADPWLLFDRNAAAWANDLTQMAPTWGYWVKPTAPNP